MSTSVTARLINGRVQENRLATLVRTENSESGEKSRVLGRVAVVSPACSSSCRSIVSGVARRFRRRADLELENLVS
jgi:hypothetical protein